MRAVSNAKRARLGSSVGPSGPGSVRATPATATRRGQTINSAASSIVRPAAAITHANTRIPSTSRIPAPPSSPTQNRQGATQKTGPAFALDSKDAPRPSFRAQHSFRPRPSTAGNVFFAGARAPSGSMNDAATQGASQASMSQVGQGSSMGMPRSTSDHSIAGSETTVVVHRPSTNVGQDRGARRRGPRPSSALVTNLASKTKYARPSVGGLGDAPSIRTVSSERASYRIPSGGYAPAGPNWAVLDEDDEDVFESPEHGAGAVPQHA
ncbi:hypothetical protein CBOM_03590 [Ceraceosorus bombacis]|uniref:Uncharacterized protein n=1 Tax=Ceraceosorus bombacis TaxID=401625 RepID=A0A0P1BGN3_9BASI|nr:hypothetical protein CBOM_03590 [Ceraceosorus bombacis]